VELLFFNLNTFMTNCLLLSLAEPATAGLKEGEESRERALSFTYPRIQIFY